MEPPTQGAAGALDLDELLKHRRFLQGLVRGILADEQGVEDVLQETWLKALEQPPGTLGSVRAWLARVARNRALNRLRSERRGVERERRAARPELVDATALDTVQKLERQQQVLAAVLRLREPRRTTVHLRYFEDREPAEIARVLDVSVNTVNDRLRRGREELRRELARELGADGSARGVLGLYLLPLAGLSKSATTALQAQLAATAAAATTGAVATTTLAPTLLGGLLMSKKVLVAGTIALLAAGVWWTLGGPRSSPTDERGRPAVAAATQAPEQLVEGDRPEVAVAAVPAAPAAERAAVVAPLTITGIVQDRDDRPVPDVGLRARLWLGYELAGEADASEVLRADAEGRFAWSPVRPQGAFVVEVGPADEGYVGYGDQALVLAGAAPRELVVGAYALDSSIRGFVRDTEGHPLAGATVAGHETVTTAADGSYVLPSPSQSYGMFTASAPGFAARREVMEGVPPGGARLDFELQRELRITGRITDEDGRPVEGVAVTTFFANKVVVTSDAEGYYELGNLDPARERHSLFGRKPGFIEATATVESTPDLHAEQDLVMRPGTRVTGRVVDDRGRPLAGASLYIGFSPNAYDRLDAVAGDDGTFVFPHVKPGKQTIGTHRDGFAPDVRDFELAEDQRHLDDLVIELHEGRVVEGYLFDDASQPVAGVLAHARYKGDWIETRAYSDEEGHFRLEGLPLTEIVLHFYKRGWVRAEAPLADGEVEPLEVVLARAGQLAGRVVDGATDQPVTVFTVRLLHPECPDGPNHYSGVGATWVREGHSFSSDDGAWDTGDDNLEPGRSFGVEVTAPGYAAGIDPCVLVEVEPDPEAHVIRLFPGRKVEGVVLDRATGLPLAGAVVKRSLVKVINPHEPYDVQLATTDDDGQFVLKDVPPGTTSLLIEHANWEKEFRDGPFEVTATGPTPYREIEIGGGTSITGVVLDEDGKPIPHALVELEGEAQEILGDYAHTTRADADGRFAFHDLSDGVYMVARARGERPISSFRMIVFLNGGNSRDIVLGPERGSASLAGTIESDPAQPGLPDLPVWIALWPESFPNVTDPIPSWGAVARDGVFRIDGLPAGSYKAMVQHRDEATGASYFGQADLEVEAGASARVTVPVIVRP